MTRKTAALLSLLFLAAGAAAQKPLRIVRSNAENIDVREERYAVRKRAWRIVPEEKLDVYTTSAKKVTFITDLEAASFDIDPKVGTYDFILLLNGKDSARTQIRYDAKAPIQKPVAYLDTLKKGRTYHAADQRPIPAFRYQPMDDPNLVRIRKDLKLDSIAGTGSELSQIFNLLHWVHNEVRHDGSSNNPALRNAVDLVRVCKEEKRGVNCRMLATILNECYLAMGIKSRYITCMPKETEFDDCHVINMVYSKELKKWIWIDPTFDAYVMDEKGNLLGIREVRERLIGGQPLVLNADANWNRSTLQTKDDYLDRYMAKNLYRLETPVVSEYDSETATRGKKIRYVELLPLDGLVQTPQEHESTNDKTGVTYVNYKTNNPELFWAKPL